MRSLDSARDDIAMLRSPTPPCIELLEASQIFLPNKTNSAFGDVSNMKDREEVMDNVTTHEDWRVCFSEAGPGLVLFARQWVRSTADAEDIVQEAFVRFWRRNHNLAHRG